MKKILLVDDDRELIEELAEMIRAEGFQTDTASTGPEGEQLLLAGDYAVAVIDFKMPGFDGITLLKKIRHHLVTTKIILLSGSLDIRKKVEEEHLEPLVSLVIQKPFDAEELIRHLKSLTAP